MVGWAVESASQSRVALIIRSNKRTCYFIALFLWQLSFFLFSLFTCFFSSRQSAAITYVFEYEYLIPSKLSAAAASVLCSECAWIPCVRVVRSLFL